MLQLISDWLGACRVRLELGSVVSYSHMQNGSFSSGRPHVRVAAPQLRSSAATALDFRAEIISEFELHRSFIAFNVYVGNNTN